MFLRVESGPDWYSLSLYVTIALSKIFASKRNSLMKRQFHSVFSNVVNYINVPPYLYRYENQEFIDKFFETGEILISSFHQYKKYEDNQLGDKSEGSTFNVGHTSNNKTVSTFTTVGMNSYCFCTSTLLDKKLFKVFSRNAVFVIKDPINFILQIEKSLSRITEVLYGNCIYIDKKMLIKQLPAVELEKLQDDNDPTKISSAKLMATLAQLDGPEQFFIKKINYQAQSEYRLIWNCDRTVTDPILIKCPEAIQFCEKIDLK
jgi:hypothetical protein